MEYRIFNKEGEVMYHDFTALHDEQTVRATLRNMTKSVGGYYAEYRRPSARKWKSIFA